MFEPVHGGFAPCRGRSILGVQTETVACRLSECAFSWQWQSYTRPRRCTRLVSAAGSRACLPPAHHQRCELSESSRSPHSGRMPIVPIRARFLYPCSTPFPSSELPRTINRRICRHMHDSVNLDRLLYEKKKAITIGQGTSSDEQGLRSSTVSCVMSVRDSRAARSHGSPGGVVSGAGAGRNTTMFRVANAVLYRALPSTIPTGLSDLRQNTKREHRGHRRSRPDRVEEQARSFDQISRVGLVCEGHRCRERERRSA